MKKLLLTICLTFFALAVSVAAPIFADDYVFQKQIIVNNAHTCQAFRIHANWFATAAHCVDVCVSNKACQVKILLAQGEVSAFTVVGASDIFVPAQYRTVDDKARVHTHKNWDVALIHYLPEEYSYEYAEGGAATEQEFRQALEQSRRLKVQWKGTTRPEIPVLHTYGGEGLMTLKQNLIVPRWENGQMFLFSDPKTILYFGEKQSLWGSDGFGVTEGNSGGAVVLEGGGIVGIATAIADNQLPSEVRVAFPEFGRSHDFFLFNGFAPKTTLEFIKKTMAQYGDQPTIKKLKRIKPMNNPLDPGATAPVL